MEAPARVPGWLNQAACQSWLAASKPCYVGVISARRKAGSEVGAALRIKWRQACTIFSQVGRAARTSSAAGLVPPAPAARHGPKPPQLLTIPNALADLTVRKSPNGSCHDFFP